MGIISSKATDAERRTSCTMYDKHKLSKEITVSLSVSQRFRVQRALVVCKIEVIVCFVKCIGVMVILWHKSNISCKEIRLPRLHQHISSPSTKCFRDCWQRVLLVEWLGRCWGATKRGWGTSDITTPLLLFSLIWMSLYVRLLFVFTFKSIGNLVCVILPSVSSMSWDKIINWN